MIPDAAVSVFYLFGAVCFYFGIVSLAYYPLALAYPFWSQRILRRARSVGYAPSVSVLVPAYNEERTIAVSLASILASDYPGFEVIVVDDGSTDRTADQVRQFLTDPRVRYIRKTNGGKASALNRGLAIAAGEIVLFTDADSLFERETIRNGVAYFIEPSVGAVSGDDTPLEPRGALQKMLVVTSHIGTGFVRRALSAVGVLQIISGNLGLVRTELLRRVGGFREIWGEDLELTVRLHREGVRVVYGAATRVLAECPHTIAGLWRQRMRWMRSYIKVLLLHRDMIGNPRYGRFGLFLAFNFLNMVLVPVLQAAALVLLPLAVATGRVDLAGWEWVAYLGWIFLFAAAVVAILLDRKPRDLLHIPYAALLVFFSYFYNAVVIYSIWAELRSHAEEWNKLDRRDLGALASGAGRRSAVVFAAAFLALAAVGAAGYWYRATRVALPVDTVAGPLPPLFDQKGTTAVAIHFDGWRDWRDAYRTLLATPQARFVNRVGISAGRADWTHFRWTGHDKWWSPQQSRFEGDMLEVAVAALQARGYRTTAIFDVFAERYLQSHPEAAALDHEGRRSSEVACLHELARGGFGRQLVAATEALAASTRADSVAVTELFYDKYCFDDESLADYRRASGRADWPRTRSGRIDWENRELDAWRSRELAGVVERLSKAVRSRGKTFALDVKISRADLTRNAAEYAQDYALLAPWVDEFIVWDYFGIEGLPPESSARIAAYLDDEFGPARFYLSLGLWGRFNSTLSAESFARGLRSGREGGAERFWITPAKDMTSEHWDALEHFVRAGNAEPRLSRR